MLRIRNHSIIYSQLNQHGGCWWLGVYLAPGHMQPWCWRRPFVACEFRETACWVWFDPKQNLTVSILFYHITLYYILFYIRITQRNAVSAFMISDTAKSDNSVSSRIPLPVTVPYLLPTTSHWAFPRHSTGYVAIVPYCGLTEVTFCRWHF